MKWIPLLIGMLWVITLQGQDGFTRDEYDAQLGCVICHDSLDIIERRNENLKAQVDVRGVMLLNREGKIASLEMLLERANELLRMEMSKKPRFKDLGFWQKLWAWCRGVAVGVVIGVGLLAAS